MFNEYEFNDEKKCMVCHTLQGDFIFDLEDYEKIKDYKWYLNPKKYANALALDNNNKRKYVFASRIIMDCPEDMVVDHINKDTLDNRKENLRIITTTENNRWKKIARNNKYGITGIYLDKETGYWNASICVNLKQIYLGYYKTKEEAIIARLLAEKKYYSEFAPQQHLFDEYKINERYYDGIEIQTPKERKRHKWTEDEDEKLKKLYESGMETFKIAELLGLSKTQIEGHVWKKHYHRKR